LDNVHFAQKAQRSAKTRERFEKLQKSQAQQNVGASLTIGAQNISTSPQIMSQNVSTPTQRTVQGLTGSSVTPVTSGDDGDQQSFSTPASTNASKYRLQWVQGQTQKQS
jgi:hypothetical protein